MTTWHTANKRHRRKRGQARKVRYRYIPLGGWGEIHRYGSYRLWLKSFKTPWWSRRSYTGPTLGGILASVFHNSITPE